MNIEFGPGDNENKEGAEGENEGGGDETAKFKFIKKDITDTIGFPPGIYQEDVFNDDTGAPVHIRRDAFRDSIPPATEEDFDLD